MVASAWRADYDSSRVPVDELGIWAKTRGTVAVRVPDDEFALKLLTEHGPLAVSSANKTGQEAALDAQTAGVLGEDVAVVIDGGARPKPLESEPNEDGVIVVTEREPAPSTILDCTLLPYVVVQWGDSVEESARSCSDHPDSCGGRRAGRLMGLRKLPRRLSRLLLSVLWMSRLTWMRRTSRDSTHTVSGEPARRASAPAAGSVCIPDGRHRRCLLHSAPAWIRSVRGYRDNTRSRFVRMTHPVPADTARALVFGESKIETATQGEAKPAETKTEAARTESEAKTEQKDMPENQL